MKNPRTPQPSDVPRRRWLTLGCVLAASTPTLDAAIVNRWSFNSTAGDAPSGATVANEVQGGDPAVILGDGARFTGSAIKLPGGPSNIAAYVDLPNGIVSGLTEVTIEGWVTVDTGGFAWTRAFDIGDSAGQELPGPGGGGDGTDYLMLSLSRNADYNIQRLEWRNFTANGPGPEATATFDSAVPTVFGQSFHFAVTVQPDGFGGSYVNYWRDGVQITMDGAAPFTLEDINDVNNWLGRSNWTADANAAASYDEFRIYDTALDETAILASIAAGPNAGLSDTDGDGMPNSWELLYPSILDPDNAADAALDSDGDGLTNLAEFQHQTNPLLTDTDGDGLTDGAEVHTHGTDPTNPDTDGDGLTDSAEINTHATDPKNEDTDGDGFTDGSEVAQNTDPKNPLSLPPHFLAHRYTFNETAGSTSTTVQDSLGAAHGQILGEGFVWNGSELVLDGGSGDIAAYVDLPDGFLSRHSVANGGLGAVTIEGWITINESSSSWARILDFGSSIPSSIPISGPGNTNGGGVEARDYIMLSAYNGTDATARQLEWRNEDPHRGGGRVFTTYTTATFGSQFHFVLTIDEFTNRARVYENGTLAAEITFDWNLADLNDINCWLGRSNWTADGNAAASFDELRVYSGMMPAAQAAANTTAGPGVVPVADTDGDGIPDAYEVRYGLDRNNPADASSDTDGDGLTALQESRRGSSPNAADTDGDGLPDSVETNTGVFVSATNTGTRPDRADTDGDGASDSAEVAAGTNPFVFDTDEDGISDGVEITQGTNPNLSEPVFPPLAHRWAFNEPAGDAPDGTTSPDLAGNAPAVIRGAGAFFTGSAIELPGGASATAAYVDLANGILSSRRIVTLEGWYSVTSGDQAWARVFDFGDADGAELTGPGGAGAGTDYLMLSASRGTNYGQQRFEVRDENPTGGGTFTFDSDVATPIGEDAFIHIVVTVDNSIPGTTVLNYWRDGVNYTSNATFPGNTSEINDVNNWLGRSNWTGDSNLAGSFDEFRVYDGILNEEAVLANLAAGPDAPPGGVTPPSADFAILSVTRNPETGALTLTWSSQPGASYIIQQSPSLAVNGWVDIPGTVASEGTTTSVTIAPPAGQPIYHFRIKRQ